MYKENFCYRIPIREQLIEIAKERVQNEKGDVHSKYTKDPLGILTGYIGEVVFKDLFPNAEYHTHHKNQATKFDFWFDGYKIDVKTSKKKEGYHPKPWYGTYAIPQYVRDWYLGNPSDDEKTDYYVLCDTNHDYTELYLLGMVDCEKFYQNVKSTQFPNGDIGWSVTYKFAWENSVLPLYEKEMKITEAVV